MSWHRFGAPQAASSQAERCCNAPDGFAALEGNQRPALPVASSVLHDESGIRASGAGTYGLPGAHGEPP